MADLIVEVDEAMKQERLERLWQSYGGFFMGLIAMLILGTAANAGYTHWQERKNIEQTDVYLDALIDNGQTVQNLSDASQKIKNPNIKAIANIHAAGLALKENDAETAVNLYAQNKDINPALQNLATLMAITKNPKLTGQEKLDALKPMYENESNPWHLQADLEAALISAHTKKDYTSARLHLKKIIDEPNIPSTLKKKAQSLDILYALKNSKK